MSESAIGQQMKNPIPANDFVDANKMAGEELQLKSVEKSKSIENDSPANVSKSGDRPGEFTDIVQNAKRQFDDSVSIGSHQYCDYVRNSPEKEYPAPNQERRKSAESASVRAERNGERQGSDAVRNVPGWTLIKDALPDDSAGDFYTLAVMTSAASQKIGIASYGFYLASYVAKHAGWFIAWMPLPPLPEVET